MKKSRNKKKQNNKKSLTLIEIMIFIAIFFMLALMVIIPADRPKPFQKIEGRIKGLHQTQNETGGVNEVIVKLVDERVVRISRAGLKKYVKGKRVLLQEYSSRIFGRSSFRFIKYIELNSYEESEADSLGD
ncbi:MAG: hypothetical protein GY795_48880 [Desulfobacterales bacterium]|nr:hypothetical protein [Desulfobacterales bacterium]